MPRYGKDHDEENPSRTGPYYQKVLQLPGPRHISRKSKLGLDTDSQSLIQVVIEALAQRHTSAN